MRAARLALLACATGAALAAAPAAAAPPAVVYGLELENRRDGERLLVFARGDVEPRVESEKSDVTRLVLPNAVLDEAAPTRLAPRGAREVQEVVAREQRTPAGPWVEIDVVRTPGRRAPELVQRGATLALVFAPSAPAPTLNLGFEAGALADVVETVARATGEVFLFDERLQGAVTLALSGPVTADEARTLLDAVLLMEGFAAVPTPGGAWRVLPLPDAHAIAPYRAGRPPDPDSDAPVATLVPLEAADPRSLAATLQPWLGSQALAVAPESARGLVLVASQAKLSQLLHVISVLDAAAAEELLVRRLRHRGAEELGRFLEEAARDELQPGARAQVWSDPRANLLLVKARPERLDELRGWIGQLDRPPQGDGDVHVRRSRHADPEDLARILRELQAGGGGASGAAPGDSPEPALRSGRALRDRDFTVTVDAPTRSLVVQADPETWAVIDELLDTLDRAPQSIAVEVAVLEVATDGSLSLGFDAFLPIGKASQDLIANLRLDPTGGGFFQPGEGDGPAFGGRYTREPLVIPIVDDEGNPIDLLVPRETAVLTAEERQVHGRVLARPHLLLLSGEEHEIDIGDNIPVQQSRVVEASTGALQNQIDVNRQDVGVLLRVRPSLGQGGRVRLEVGVELSRLTDSVAGDPDEVGPTIEQRRLESTVWLWDDEVVVLALGTFPEYASVDFGTPWLMDVPLLGHLFRSSRQELREAHVLITAQARVLPGRDDTVAESVRRRIGLERVMARVAPLDPAEGAFALRVATRRLEADAVALRDGFLAEGREARVVAWSFDGDERWDVVLVGFETPGALSEASREMRRRGLRSEWIAVPGARLSL